MSLKGKKQTPEHRAKISKALTGRKVNYKSEESRLRAISNLQTNYWLGKKRSKEDREKISKSHIGLQVGDKNGIWKGDKVGYIALHDWVRRYKGKPKKCKHCKATYKERRLTWANIDHTYKRVLDDYIELCYSCHKKYDLKNNLKPDNKVGNNQFTKSKL